MEAFGAIASSIDLVQKIKATFDQARTNRKDGLILLSEIIDSLLRIQELLQQYSFVNSPELRDDLSNFENALRATLSRRQRLTRPQGNGLWDRSVIWSKEIYYSSDTKSELIELRQRIHAHYQSLQIKCLVRMDDGVANANVHLEAIRGEELPAVKDEVAELRAAMMEISDRQNGLLLNIEAKVEQQVTNAEQDIDQAQKLVGLRKMNVHQVSESLKSTTEALQAGGSDSELENRYLKVKVKALTEALPKLMDGNSTLSIAPLPSSTLPTTWKTFYPQMVKDDDKRDDSVQEVMRILKLLRGGSIISYADVVNTLEHLRVALSELGLSSEQVEICNWVVRVRRQKANDDDVASALALAQSLHNLAKPLIDIGKYADAMEVSKEAVDICRQRSKSDPELLPNLASVLTNYSITLSNLGKCDDAQIASGESVDIFRKLVENHPAGGGWVQKLGGSLMLHSCILNSLGRSEEALSLAEESVNIYRKLVQNQETRVLPGLARSLTACSSSLTMLGRHSDSLQVQEEVVQIYRTLVGDHQKQFYSPDLAKSLLKLSNSLVELRSYEASISPLEESVKIYRSLITVEHTRFWGDLAVALNGIAWRQHKLGRHREALLHVEEALQLLSKCERTHNPDFQDFQLAMTLNSRSFCLSGLDQHDQAIVAGQASLEIGRRLNRVNPGIYIDIVPRLLLNYSRTLCRGGGDLKEARVVAEESVGHYRTLANKTPLKYNTDLKGALEHLSRILSALGDEEGAKDASEEASKLSC